MKENKSCCVIGHSDKNFLWDYSSDEQSYTSKYLADMKNEIKQLIGNGYIQFIVDARPGVGMDFAETLINNYKSNSLKLHIVSAYKGQEKRWSKLNQRRYHNILKQANSIKVISSKYNTHCIKQRYEYMINNTDMAFIFWNCSPRGNVYNAVRYAENIKKKIKCYDFPAILKETKEIEEYLNNLIDNIPVKSFDHLLEIIKSK